MTVSWKSRRRRIAIGLLVALAAVLTTVPASQARPNQTRCTLTLSGPRWKLASASGTTYKIVAHGYSCAAARPWVATYIHQTGKGLGQTLKGPAGLICPSYAQLGVVDAFVYAGTCHHANGGVFFGWAPKPT